MNWLERARREIRGIAVQSTADTAEGNPTAAMTVLGPGLTEEPVASIVSNGSVVPRQMMESEAVREAFEERAAIMEYDGGMTREDAARAAWALVSKHLLH